MNRPGQCDFFDHDPIALSPELPWLLTAGMLLVGHQDFVARLHINAVSDIAVGLGSVTDQGNFVAMAAHKRSQGIAELVPCRVSPYGVVLRVLLVQLFGLRVGVKNSAQNWGGART